MLDQKLTALQEEVNLQRSESSKSEERNHNQMPHGERLGE